MKKYIINTAYLFSPLVLFAGCDKNEINYGDTVEVTDKALLKFNYASAYQANPSVHISINGQRVSNLIQHRTPFPGGGFNTLGSSQPDYLSVDPGTMEVSIVIPKRNTNTDSV